MAWRGLEAQPVHHFSIDLLRLVGDGHFGKLLTELGRQLTGHLHNTHMVYIRNMYMHTHMAYVYTCNM